MLVPLCTVLRLVSPGNVSICPCSYSYWYPCFAWSARAMNLFARVHTCAVCESLHSVYCACIPCTVLRLVRTGNVPTCPCSHSYWYLLCSPSLGQHGQCTYLPVVVLVLIPLVQCFAWTAWAMNLCARACILVQCAAFRLDSTVNVPTYPWSYSYRYLLCSASLGQYGLCAYVPALVSLYSVLLWVTRAMYVSSCLDSRAVLVALLLLTWTFCW